MDCSRRRTLELGLGAVGSVTLLAGCSDEGPGSEDGGGNESGGNQSNGTESDGNRSSNESGGNETDEQPDHPNEIGDDMQDDAEPTGFAPDANESNESNDSDDGAAGPERDD